MLGWLKRLAGGNGNAARAQQEGRRLFGRMPGSDAPRANVAHAYNASGQAAPMHGVVDLVAPSQTESQLEFVKPGSGSETYGIALDPIAPYGLKTMGRSGEPECAGTTVSRYVPPLMRHSSPGFSRSAAFWIVPPGACRLPQPSAHLEQITMQAPNHVRTEPPCRLLVHLHPPRPGIGYLE